MTLEELKLLRDRIQQKHDEALHDARTGYGEDTDWDWGQQAAYETCLAEIDRFIPLT